MPASREVAASRALRAALPALRRLFAGHGRTRGYWRVPGRRPGRGRIVARVTAAVLLLAVVAATVTPRAQQAPQSTRDGIYSPVQAERGRVSFEAQCTECHELVEFTGADAYFDEMLGTPLWEILDFIWTEMPEDRPAWLDEEEYADILAYLLSAYGMPAGARELPIEQAPLEAIRLEAAP